ncbi:MAG: UDP-glucose/GDP-mannose dehydrogenase family protein [Nitrospiraceae bacterium]
MNISIVGTGYVGLVTGTCLAATGHRVTCVDLRANIVDMINAGQPPIYEIGLEALLAQVVKSRNLTATTGLEQAVLNSEVTLVCVGTPTIGSDADLSQIERASQSIGEALKKKSSYHVVVVKSTVLPGTTEGVVRKAIEAGCGRPLGDGWGLCMNPEFLREGQAVEDCRNPDRIVIGASDERAGQLLSNVYAPFSCPIVVTMPRTAEMIKYVANSLFATLISFSNEVGNLCASVPGIDAREVWRGVHLDRRLTPMKPKEGQAAEVVYYLWHGLGFGGSCFPKDVAALRGFGTKQRMPTAILDAVLQINEAQPLQLVELLKREMDVAKKRVAILGIAFKPGTDDLRHSPAAPVIRALLAAGASVVVHDPIAMPMAKQQPEFAGVEYAEHWQGALTGADACCLVTSWPEYKVIEAGDCLRLMRKPVVIDGRGFFDRAAFMKQGVTWRGVGYTPAAQ